MRGRRETGDKGGKIKTEAMPDKRRENENDKNTG